MAAFVANTEDCWCEIRKGKMKNLINISFNQYDKDIDILIKKLKNNGISYTGVYGVPRGGYYPAIYIANALNLPVLTQPIEKCLVVDDILDSGKTAEKNGVNAVVYCEEHSKDRAASMGIVYGVAKDGWLNIPDEKDEGIEDHIRRVLEYIGEDPTRPGLIGTPDRIRRMLGELFRGYDPKQKPKITVFNNGNDGIVYDSMVVDSGTFNSICEHHLMPFWGKYWFAYIPNPKGKILGLSKIGRVVDYCAARAQIQERLVHDVVDMLAQSLGTENPPLGIALVMKAHHGCKEFRGVKKKGVMTSSFLQGQFRNDQAVRAEFMRFVSNDRYE